MSTSAVIMIHGDGPSRGIAVHYDGEPQRILEAVRAMIRRDGAGLVRDTLLKYPYWTSLDADTTAESEGVYSDDIVVVGYGIASGMKGAEFVTRETLDDVEREYLYTLGVDGTITIVH